MAFLALSSIITNKFVLILIRAREVPYIFSVSDTCLLKCPNFNIFIKLQRRACARLTFSELTHIINMRFIYMCFEKEPVFPCTSSFSIIHLYFAYFYIYSVCYCFIYIDFRLYLSILFCQPE